MHDNISDLKYVIWQKAKSYRRNFHKDICMVFDLSQIVNMSVFLMEF